MDPHAGRKTHPRGRVLNGEPFPDPALKPIKHPKNIANFALDVKNYFASNPGASQSDAATRFKVTHPRISQLLKIANNLPAQLLKKLVETDNPALIKKYSGKRLLVIATGVTSSNKTCQNRHLISNKDLPLHGHTSKEPYLGHDTPRTSS